MPPVETTPQNLDEIIAQSMERSAVTIPVVEETVEPSHAPLPERKEHEKKTEEKKKEKKTETSQEDEKDELGLTKAEQAQARQLLAALKDPEKAQIVIQHLMKSSGIEAPETRKEVREVKKALVDQLKESLGPELAYLADKMGPVFQSFLDEKIQEVQGKNEERFSQAAIEREEAVATTAQFELSQELFGTTELPTDFIQEVSRLIDVYKPTKGQTTKSYLKDMIQLASGRLGKPITKAQTQQRKTETMDKNRTDAASRLASDGKSQPAPGSEVSTRTEKDKPMSLDDAIRVGLEQTNAKFQTE